MQEARWDVRKPFSGSIRQERVGKGERRRDTQGPGGQESLQGTACAFPRVLLHSSERPAALSSRPGHGQGGHVGHFSGVSPWPRMILISDYQWI